MAALQIPSGWNQKRQRDDLPENANPDEFYTCLDCKQRLIVIPPRVDPGNVRVRQHFKHRPDALHRRCDYRLKEEVETIRQETIKGVREAIEAKRLRLFLDQKTYSEDFELRAHLPALTDDDARDLRMATGKAPGSVISITATTALKPIPPQLLLPNQAAIRVPLDASKSDHQIKIDGPTQFSIKGTWTANLPRNAVFVGQEESAEFVQAPKYILEGQTLFFRPRDMALPPGARLVKVQQVEYIRITASKENFDWLKSQVPSLLALDTSPLRANIILPFLHDPRAERFIRAPAGAKCVLGVVAGKKLDPELEVADIGRADTTFETLPPTGPGEARFIEFDIPPSRRQLILLWPYVKGREIVLDVAPAAPDELPHIAEPEFGVEVIGKGQVAVAEFEETLELGFDDELKINPRLATAEHPLLPDRVKLRGFGGMRVHLRAEYPNEEGQPRWRDAGVVTDQTFTESVESLITNGSRNVEVDFGPLGRVIVHCDYFYNQRIKDQRRDAEARAHQRTQTILPRAPRQTPVPLPTTTALDALEARSKQRRLEQEARATKQQQQQEERQGKEDELSLIRGDPPLQRRIRQEGIEPRDVNIARTARIAQIPHTPENYDELSRWRYAIRRWLKENPTAARKKLRSTRPDAVSPKKHVPTVERRVHRHHDERRRKDREEPEALARSKRDARARRREEAKLEEARRPPPSADAKPPEPAPNASRSIRDQLKELQSRARAGERVELPKPKLPKATPKPTAPEKKLAPPPQKRVGVLDFDRKLRRLDELPAAVTTDLVASVYRLTPAEAEQTHRENKTKLEALFAREKERRKRDEDAAKTRRDTR